MHFKGIDSKSHSYHLTQKKGKDLDNTYHNLSLIHTILTIEIGKIEFYE